jgi:DNA-binding response OmpR family regulator
VSVMSHVDHNDIGSVSVQRRILVVEDDPFVREMIAQYLELEDFELTQAASGADALKRATEHPPDLVILDLNLPGIDGLEVARRLRAMSAVPILMLTGRADDNDKLAGFGVGADDYVTKPFQPRELVMRVRAVMRRLAASTTPAIVLDDALRVGDLLIRPRLREVLRDGAQLELTAMEFDLLHFLASHPRQVFSRKQLLHHVWQYDFGDESTVTVHMSRLRDKVESDPTKPYHLRTVWRVGYKFEP